MVAGDPQWSLTISRILGSSMTTYHQTTTRDHNYILLFDGSNLWNYSYIIYIPLKTTNQQGPTTILLLVTDPFIISCISISQIYPNISPLQNDNHNQPFFFNFSLTWVCLKAMGKSPLNQWFLINFPIKTMYTVGNPVIHLPFGDGLWHWVNPTWSIVIAKRHLYHILS